jgi:hypothetical protein
MPSVNNYSAVRSPNKTAIINRADSAKNIRNAANPRMSYPTLKKSSPGFVRISTLIAIPVGLAGFVGGALLQAKILGVKLPAKQEHETVSYTAEPSQPIARANLASIGAAGVIGTFIAVGLVKLPSLLNQNGGK